MVGRFVEDQQVHRFKQQTDHGQTGIFSTCLLYTSYIVENYDKWDKIAEEYAPEIIRYSNGQLVQRTPTEYECPHWMQQSWTISYNTYYLDADNRGCNSCHADMNAMIENMEYKHATIDNKALETYSDVNQCISCHRDNGDDFGRLIPVSYTHLDVYKRQPLFF